MVPSLELLPGISDDHRIWAGVTMGLAPRDTVGPAQAHQVCLAREMELLTNPRDLEEGLPLKRVRLVEDKQESTSSKEERRDRPGWIPTV